jgi:hypothetical protein
VVKRVQYSIPWIGAGLALSSIGCGGSEPPPDGDELTDSTFTVNLFNGFPTPYAYASRKDVSAAEDGSVNCYVAFANTDVTFDANLVGSTIYSHTYSGCVDANGAAIADPALIPPNTAYTYTIAATTVEVNAKYNITFTDPGGLSLQINDCTFTSDTGVFECFLPLEFLRLTKK